MSYKTLNNCKKFCERSDKHSGKKCSAKAEKIAKCVPPKKVVSSKKFHTNIEDCKSCSTGEFYNTKKFLYNRPKKTTKSEHYINTKQDKINTFDFCKKCGDFLSNNEVDNSKINNEEISSDTFVSKSCKSIKSNKNTSTNSKKENQNNGILNLTVQQYYKNEHFRQLSESICEMGNDYRKISNLDTIKELPEQTTSNNTKNTDNSEFSIINSDISEEELESLDDHDTIRKLNEFRRNNYFECHSTNSRIKKKGNVTALGEHKCVYRFYLNDRLFPVPLASDHNNDVRCVECHLPMEFNEENIKNQNGKQINSTIQAKVQIGSDKKLKDILIMLPIQEPLIIKERRKEEKQSENEVLYFGIIKLDLYGNSVFNPTLPNDSLALRYQKGYKEFYNNNCDYTYKSMEKGDVVIV